MFINTGLLLQAEDPNEVIGVVAHELGHIVGGHQIRLRERIENASRIAKWTSLLGIGIGAAGAVSGNNQVDGGAVGGGFFIPLIAQYFPQGETATAGGQANTGAAHLVVS